MARETKWIRALNLAQKINRHTGSCWNTGGAEICERCITLAHQLEEELKNK